MPHRPSSLKHGGPADQTSLASEAYCSRRLPICFFQAPLICRRQGFLVLEPSLGLQFYPPLGHFPFHCRLVVPEKRDEVPDERELHDFDLSFRCLAKQGLGLWQAVQVKIGESHIFVADGEIRIELDRLVTFFHGSVVMTS